jgi:O-antigen/teichoic acid export membrane protein
MTDATGFLPADGSLTGKIRGLLFGHSDNARSGRRAISIFLIRVTSAVLVYLSQVLLARWMGSFEFGIYAYVWVWVIVLGSLTPLGLNTAILKFIPHYTSGGEEAALKGVIYRSRHIVLGFSSLVAVAGIGLVFLLRDYMDNYYVLPLMLGLICVPLFALGEMHEGISRNYGWTDLAFLPPYIARPLLLLFIMGTITLMGFTPCGAAALLASIIASFIAIGVQNLLLLKRLKTVMPVTEADYRVAEWLKISTPILLVEGFYMLLAHIDTLMLQLFAAPQEVGIYFASTKTTGLIGFIYFAVTAVFAHRLAALHSEGRMHEFALRVRSIIHWIFWPSLAAGLGLYLLGRPVLWLYGPDFMTGYPVMMILLAGMLVRAATGPVEFMLNMTGYQNATAWVLGSTVVLNLILNSLLIPRFGMVGAASGTVSSVIFASACLYLLVRRKLGINAFILARLPVDKAA